MIKIDEWTPLFPKNLEPLGAPPFKRSFPSAQEVADRIYRLLVEIRPTPPIAVHFYLGEGLRWIRVGFGGSDPLRPPTVGDIGRRIASCVPEETLFFHALRPYDMLFFLADGELESSGMPATDFGAPLVEVLNAWKLHP